MSDGGRNFSIRHHSIQAVSSDHTVYYRNVIITTPTPQHHRESKLRILALMAPLSQTLQGAWYLIKQRNNFAF
jgi:hypothetical protein